MGNLVAPHGRPKLVGPLNLPLSVVGLGSTPTGESQAWASMVGVLDGG